MRLKDDSKEKEKTLDNKKTTPKQVKKVSQSKEPVEIKNIIAQSLNSVDMSTKTTNENEKVDFLDNKNEIELKDEINNARKKRRRSSASIE